MTLHPQTPDRNTKRKEPPSIHEERQEKMTRREPIIRKIQPIKLNGIVRTVWLPICVNLDNSLF